jgi:spermidine synthase
MKSELLIFKTKYASLSITRSNNTLELRSGTEALHSVINIKKPHKLALKNLQCLMGILLFLPTPENILLLGTGGGSLIHFLRFYYPQCRLTSVDLDAELQELMHEKMLLPRASESLVYVVDDAAHYLHQCHQQFDLILVDIFAGSQSPDWLLDSPSIQQIHTLLSDQGAVAYNLLIDSEHTFNLFYRNLTQVFAQQALFLPVEGYDNNLAYGFRYRPPQREMSYYMQHASDMAELHEINYNEVLAAIYTNNPIGSGII